jgi:CRISPR-associated exonuclease Cas4
MGLDPGEGKITLHFESHDPTHVFKSLQLYVDQMGITSPAGEVGAGLQSAIVVGIFRTYEELKKEGAVFAVEEPEVFLHPQKARYFEAVLRRLSENGNQVFLTTHSPIFVRIDQPETVAKVHRTKDRGTWISQATKVEIAENDRKALRLMTEFDAQRNELFFASKVMLVEGITEKIALSLVFRALGIDINQSGISIVECGGKTKLPLFVLVVKALGIPYIVLADEDTHKDRPEKENNKHKQWNEALQNVADADRLFFLKPDFESEVGLPHDESEKVSQALIRFQSMKAAEVPDCLKNPINRLLEIDKR